MSIKSLLASFILLLSCMMFTSCYQEVDNPAKDDRTEVKVSFQGFRTSVTSTRATLEETSVKRISFAVFDQENQIVEQITQSDTDSNFGKVQFILPGGEYTFVAVAHGVTSEEAGNAIIRSITEVQLPEQKVSDTYSAVQTVTIAGNKSESITMQLNQVVAHVHAISDDIVPENVSYVGLRIAPTEGASTDNTLRFNPSTGLALSDYVYNLALSATPGDPFDRELFILLSSESMSLPISITIYDSQKQPITEFSRQLEPQPFRIAYTTTLFGTLFSSLQNGTFTFNGYLGDLSGALDNF